MKINHNPIKIISQNHLNNNTFLLLPTEIKTLVNSNVMMYVIMKSRFNSQVVCYPTENRKRNRTRFIKNELKNEDTHSKKKQANIRS